MSVEQYSRRFTQEEAQAKVGKIVRATIAFSRIPEGAIGQVVEVDKVGSEVEPAAYDVVVQWDLPVPSPSADVVIPTRGEPYVHVRPGSPLVDWFTRLEYEQFLVEVD